MARNRKHNPGAIRFGPAFKAFFLCLFIGGSGIGFVWQKNEIHSLGEQIKKNEVRWVDLRRRNKIRSDQLATLCSPPMLEARMKKLNLGLVQPSLSQVIHLVEVPPENPGRDASRQQYAEGRFTERIP